MLLLHAQIKSTPGRHAREGVLTAGEILDKEIRMFGLGIRMPFERMLGSEKGDGGSLGCDSDMFGSRVVSDINGDLAQDSRELANFKAGLDHNMTTQVGPFVRIVD